MKILVYSDAGVSSLSCSRTIDSLTKERGTHSFSISEVSASTLIHENWEKETALLVIPGGRDLPYHTALKGQGNAKIARFVSKGGRYFGLCAGAYYASAVIEFARDGPHQIVEGRELAFFPGKAIGPAYGSELFCYNSERGARPAWIEWGELGSGHFYYNGGCYFEMPDNYPNVKVIGRYADISGRPAAALLCKVGKGKALLSGIHPEYSLPSLAIRFSQRDEWARLRIWRSLLHLILS